jgi:hypothetical protein
VALNEPPCRGRGAGLDRCQGWTDRRGRSVDKTGPSGSPHSIPLAPSTDPSRSDAIRRGLAKTRSGQLLAAVDIDRGSRDRCVGHQRDSERADAGVRVDGEHPRMAVKQDRASVDGPRHALDPGDRPGLELIDDVRPVVPQGSCSSKARVRHRARQASGGSLTGRRTAAPRRPAAFPGCTDARCRTLRSTRCRSSSDPCRRSNAGQNASASTWPADRELPRHRC